MGWVWFCTKSSDSKDFSNDTLVHKPKNYYFKRSESNKNEVTNSWCPTCKQNLEKVICTDSLQPTNSLKYLCTTLAHF